MIQVEPLEDSPQADEALETLLYETYVRGGFTDAILASTLLASAVRARGEVLAAVDRSGLLGTVTLVAPSSPARRLATPVEFELHLLCVRPDARAAAESARLWCALRCSVREPKAREASYCGRSHRWRRRSDSTGAVGSSAK